MLNCWRIKSDTPASNNQNMGELTFGSCNSHGQIGACEESLLFKMCSVWTEKKKEQKGDNWHERALKEILTVLQRE